MSVSEPNSERRRDIRINPGARTVRVVVAGRSYPFVLCNISSRGASGRCIVRLKPGLEILVTFENGTTCRACVRWEKGGVSGLEFGQRLPVQQVVPATQVVRPRAPRVTVSRAAHIKAGSRSARAMIWNVSEHGMMIQALCTLQAGDPVLVTVDDYRVQGVVRWANGGYVGLQLSTPLDLARFGVDIPSVPVPVRVAEPLDA